MRNCIYTIYDTIDEVLSYFESAVSKKDSESFRILFGIQEWTSLAVFCQSRFYWT